MCYIFFNSFELVSSWETRFHELPNILGGWIKINKIIISIESEGMPWAAIHNSKVYNDHQSNNFNADNINMITTITTQTLVHTIVSSHTMLTIVQMNTERTNFLTELPLGKYFILNVSPIGK